jgi:hypothetical protein
MTPDPLALLRQADPAPSPAPYDPGCATALIDRAVAADTPGTGRGQGRRTRRWRAAAAALTAAVLAGGGGAAYAVLHQPADSALGLACAAGTSRQEFEQAGGSLSSFMSVSSGDPVADCAAEYERRGAGAAPALRGYTTGTSYVSVVPADWAVPTSWQALPDTFRNDPVRLELRQRLDDVLEGPQSRCHSADEVAALVRSDLTDLGLTGWTIQRLEQARRADGRTWCALAFVDDSGSRTVLLQGLDGPASGEYPTGEPFGQVLQTLRQRIAGQCLPLPAARQVAEQAVSAAGFDPAHDAKITSIEDPVATCTRAYVPVAGLIEITLRGPDR